MKKKLRLWLPILLICISTCFCLASCSAASKGTDSVGNAAPEKSEKPLENGSGMADSLPLTEMPTDAERKIIKTYELTSETKDFDAAIASLNDLVAAHGGYVQSASVSDQSLRHASAEYTRYASFVLRIPADEVEAFVGSVGSHLHLTRNNSYAEDISETYYSIEARLEELTVERDSLLDILAAPETEKDYDLWLTVSQRLSEVKQQIAVYQGQINRYDSQVAYSTVDLAINEVVNYSAVHSGTSFWSRLGTAFADGWNGFVEGLQGFVLWFAESLPTLILLGAIVAGAVILTVKLRRRKKAKTREKQNETE